MENGLYTAHEVAVIIADLFGDDCACNFNDIDEWLPFKCELVDSCPNTYGVACWEQYLKYRHCKNEMEANMENGLYTAHEVAVIIADLFGDDCACNFNDIDEWLPFKCELFDACPNPCGVACWEQYLKYRHCKDEMEAKEDGNY